MQPGRFFAGLMAAVRCLGVTRFYINNATCYRRFDRVVEELMLMRAQNHPTALTIPTPPFDERAHRYLDWGMSYVGKIRIADVTESECIFIWPKEAARRVLKERFSEDEHVLLNRLALVFAKKVG